jgi:hypothetical protein
MRQLKPDPIPEAVLRQIMDAAICPPSGGNRQGWSFVLVRDAAKRKRLGELYREAWGELMATITTARHHKHQPQLDQRIHPAYSGALAAQSSMIDRGSCYVDDSDGRWCKSRTIRCVRGRELFAFPFTRFSVVASWCPCLGASVSLVLGAVGTECRDSSPFW